LSIFRILRLLPLPSRSVDQSSDSECSRERKVPVTTWLAIGRLRQFREAEEGRVRALTLLLLGVAMLVVGLGVDVGFLRYQNQQMQNAADLGAIAGASALILGGLVCVADQNAGDVPLKGAVLLSYQPASGKHRGRT